MDWTSERLAAAAALKRAGHTWIEVGRLLSEMWGEQVASDQVRMAQGAQLEARRTQGCQAQLQSEIAPRCEAALSGGRECLWTWKRMLQRTIVIWDKLG